MAWAASDVRQTLPTRVVAKDICRQVKCHKSRQPWLLKLTLKPELSQLMQRAVPAICYGAKECKGHLRVRQPRGNTGVTGTCYEVAPWLNQTCTSEQV